MLEEFRRIFIKESSLNSIGPPWYSDRIKIIMVRHGLDPSRPYEVEKVENGRSLP